MLKARTSLFPAALLLSAVVISAACSDDAGSGGTGTTADGGPACDTCYNVYVNGGIVCGPGDSADAWRTLSYCACGTGPCTGACAPTFCQGMSADETCGACLVMSCAAQEQSCADN